MEEVNGIVSIIYANDRVTVVHRKAKCDAEIQERVRLVTINVDKELGRAQYDIERFDGKFVSFRGTDFLTEIIGFVPTCVKVFNTIYDDRDGHIIEWESNLPVEQGVTLIRIRAQIHTEFPKNFVIRV